MNNKSTITFDEKVRGWTSFHSFNPELMLGMNSEFFSFKEGNLYLHNSDEVDRGTYYGDKFPTKVSVMLNTAPSKIKVLSAISLEGNTSWSAQITAYISGLEDNIKSSIKALEFKKKEGIWFAYARRNEDPEQLDSKAVYGIGSVLSVTGKEVTIFGGSSVMTNNDKIFRGDPLEYSGEIESFTRIGKQTIINFKETPVISSGDFIIGRKDARVEGGNLRGYTLRVDLETFKTSKVELFAVNADVFQSYP